MFAALYKVLAVAHLDWPHLLVRRAEEECTAGVADSAVLLQVLLPRVLQALLAAVGDLCVLKSASLMFGAKAGKYAVSCSKCFVYLSVVMFSSSSTRASFII